MKSIDTCKKEATIAFDQLWKEKDGIKIVIAKTTIIKKVIWFVNVVYDCKIA